MTHTKGKWVDNFLPNQDGYRHNIAVKGGPIIALIPDCDRQRAEQVDANARLIAKAPEMMEALREVADLANGQGRLNLMEVAGHARALLSDIEGEA